MLLRTEFSAGKSRIDFPTSFVVGFTTVVGAVLVGVESGAGSNMSSKKPAPNPDSGDEGI